MISCQRMHLEGRCRERGYSLEEVMPCVVSQDGDNWVVDETHPAYPRSPKPGFTPPPPPCLAGTALKRLLAGWPFQITSTSTCPCNARAAEMDSKGCDWCEEHIDEIVGWLREQAEARGLPFLDVAGRMLVRRAIGNARRAEKQS